MHDSGRPTIVKHLNISTNHISRFRFRRALCDSVGAAIDRFSAHNCRLSIHNGTASSFRQCLNCTLQKVNSAHVEIEIGVSLKIASAHATPSTRSTFLYFFIGFAIATRRLPLVAVCAFEPVLQFSLFCFVFCVFFGSFFSVSMSFSLSSAFCRCSRCADTLTHHTCARAAL